MAQCTATSKASKREGEPQRCGRHAMKGRNVCWVHGGSTPRGFALPQTKDGRHSRDLPTRLAARYEASRTDPDLLNLTEEIALTDTFIEDARRGLDHGESGRLFRELKMVWDAFSDASRDKDTARMQQAMAEIGALIRQGVGAYAARDETMGLVERRRRLVESEQKRRVAMQDMITSEQAMVLISRVLSAVKLHVDDPLTLTAIATELGGLIGSPDAGGTRA